MNIWIRNKNYIKISPSKENKVPKNKNTRHLTDNMRNTVFYSGKAALDAIRDHAIGKSPITEIYFSTHGTVYAIDFNNPPNNLYTSESNMLELAGPTWKLGESGKFIRHLKYYYDTGILSLSVTIAMGACLTGAQVVNIEKVIKDAKREKNDRFYIDLTNTLEKQYQQFVTLNKDKFKPENFAYLLSKELPGATIIAPTIRSSANRGIECPVMYQNCLRWEIMLPDHYLGIERDNTLSWLTGSMKTTLHPMPIL